MTRTPSKQELDLQARLSKSQAECTLLQEQVGRLHRAKTTMDLLAAVAHDLAAALTGVVWCSEAICRRLESHDPELAEGVSDFVGAANFARQLARRLVSISQQPETAFERCAVVDAVRESLSLLETLRPPEARLHTSYPEHELSVFGSRDQLQQVLLNLVANAFAAIAAQGGNVWVELLACEAPEEAAQASQAAGWLRLCVRDDGHGMDEDTLRKAFEPFFTTKPANDGSGIGLCVVRAAVERHGGVIRASSKAGQGTTIEVFLPTVQPAEI